MIDIKSSFKGHLDISKAFSKLADPSKDIGGLLDNSMKRAQVDAFKRAPVLTGLLSSSLVAPENVRRSDGKAFVERKLVESISYATFQEFNNPRKPGFIRGATQSEYPRIVRDFETWARNLESRYRV